MNTHDSEFFRKLADYASDWLIYLDNQGQFVYMSPACEDITGYKPEDFYNDPELFFRILHEDCKQEVKHKFTMERERSTNCALDFRIRHKDGSVRWLSHRCRPFFDSQNKIVGRISSQRDITPRKQMEIELEKNQKFLLAIFNGVMDPMHVIDKDYRIVLTNQRLLEMKKVRQEDIVGKYCYEVYQGRKEICEQCASKQVFVSKKSNSLIKTLPLHDGSYKYFEVYSFPLFDSQGEVAQVIEMTRDIANRKLAENDMLMLSSIVDQASDAVSVTDKNGNVEYVNESFVKITGYTKEEIKQSGFALIRSGYHSRKFYEDLWQSLYTGKTWKGHLINRRKDGETYYEEAVIFPVKGDEQQIKGYAKIARDITDRVKAEKAFSELNEKLSKSNQKLIEANVVLELQKKELIIAKEKAEESERLKNQFIANMSHEIRTPLNGILGFIEIMKSPNVSLSEQKRYLNIIKTSGERLADLINDILDYSRIESKLVKIKNDKVDIISLIDNLYIFFAEEIHKKGLSFILDIPELKEDYELISDGNKINQILSNLIKNAIKFTHSGEIKFGYYLDSMLDVKRIVFYVRDTGIGISPEYHQKVFERFMQADLGTTKSYEGTGLGLAICRSYTELLHGDIWLESNGKSGTVFYVALPLQ